MKKILFLVLMSVSSLMSYAGESTVSVADVSLASGQSATLAIRITGDETRQSFMTWITLPAGIAVTDVQAGPIYDTPVIAKNLDGGYYKISCMCANYYTAATGDLLYVTIEDDGTNAVGSVLPITFGNLELSDGGISSTWTPADVTCNVTITDRVILDENSTTPFVDASGINVTIKRTIKGGVWNTIVLPFDVADVEDVFGPGALAADFSGATVDGYATTTDNIEIEFSSNTEIYANTPCIIMPQTDYTSFDVNNVDIAWDDAPNVGVKTNNKSTVVKGTQFTGTYLANTEIPQHCIFLSNGKFFVAGDGTTKTKGFRAYFTPQVNGAIVALNDNSSVKIFVDGVETAIEGINEDVKSNKVYSIDGKYIGEDVDLNRMQKGIYIVNGKKVINK